MFRLELMDLIEKYKVITVRLKNSELGLPITNIDYSSDSNLLVLTNKDYPDQVYYIPSEEIVGVMADVKNKRN